MSIDWVIVTAPTDRGAMPNGELSTALRTLSARRPEVELRVAVLGGDGRSVTEALDDAAAAGADEVLVLSGQTLADRKMDAWFRRVIGHWLRVHPDEPMSVRIGRSLCDADAFADALTEAIDDGGVPAATTTAPLTSPLWERVPGFARHVLVCRGPRCSAQGAGEGLAALNTELTERELGDDDVLVTVTGCLFPCAQAPVLAVYPDNVWYAGITPERVGRVVDEHLCGGAPVTQWLGDRAGSDDVVRSRG